MEDGLPPRAEAAALPALDAEWQRIALLVGLAEAARGAGRQPEGIDAAFAEVQDAVELARAGGAWAGLLPLLSATERDALVTLDLDLLALALAPEARPALCPRLQALQPFAGVAAPALPLVQDLLMLESDAEIRALHVRLAADAPLVASGLLRLELRSGYRTLVPAPYLVRALFGRPADPGPPPGADLVATPFGSDALVVPGRTRRRISEFTAWVLHRETVFASWGGRRLGGPVALFCGGSGVGKSFSVACLTRDLSDLTGTPWALYRLNLGRIVSKYVGETEKNLNALLDSLAGRRAVLQVDEADGLLGKRGEVRDARDRYANLEVSHLLSRLEAHDGPVVLTTNLRANLDPAFLRRFQMVVEFPGPDPAERAELWRRLLPAEAPLAGDIDAGRLGAELPLAGGGIHNAAIAAAILAAAEAKPLSEAHIARAAWHELSKEARTVRPSEIGSLSRHLDPEDVL
ncbi:MAG: ATP-binding protein [Paracoccaceae bacterium]|nr:ATP-binding protein [Paracoccaceae bacterium]